MSSATLIEIAEQARSWLHENWDPDLDLVVWRNRLADAGWGVPDWPKKWFGKELSTAESSVVEQEFVALDVVGVAKTGIRMLAAATLLEHGTDEQKGQFLRGILTGQESWCQLFSEPGSGSDLAGAITRADKDGDRWVVNGQKVWTTSAHHADWGLLLARTDWDEPKHRGLTYFVINMHQPGVRVLPLRQMNHHASFNEVFMTDAYVEAGHQVGALGSGWQVALTTLAHERRRADGLRPLAVAADAKARRIGRIYEQEQHETESVMEPYKWYPQRAGRVDLALPRAVETGKINDPVVVQELAKLIILARSSQWTAKRARAGLAAGRKQGPEGSLGKLAASNVAKLAAHVHTLIAGADAMLEGIDSPRQGVISEILMSTPAVSIAGGTDEIQRNIIAERVLGMPKEPRSDTGPFRDVKRN